MGALALAAPLAWSLSDAILTGDPLWSLTGTQEATSELRRAPGLDDAILLAPRRIGEIFREPVLLGAVAGAVLAGTTFGRAGHTVLATLLLSLAAFGALATAGRPVLGRFLLLPAVLMIVLASAAVTGWTRVRAGGRARAVAQAVAVAVAAALLVLTPAQSASSLTVGDAPPPAASRRRAWSPWR